LGGKVGETVAITLPLGKRRLKIVELETVARARGEESLEQPVEHHRTARLGRACPRLDAHRRSHHLSINLSGISSAMTMGRSWSMGMIARGPHPLVRDEP